MMRPLPALLALALTSCGASVTAIPPSPIPAPPSAALIPCIVPPLAAGDSETVALALVDRAAEIANCDIKRQALVDGWPK